MKLCSQVADPFEQIIEHSSSINMRPYLNNPFIRRPVFHGMIYVDFSKNIDCYMLEH